MRDRLAELGHRPRYACELTGFDQDAEGVTARLAEPERSSQLRCRYLIGADGGRSFIRDALGIGFPGKTLGVRAIVADIVLDGIDRDAWHRFSDGDMGQQISLCPLPHSDLFQLQAPIPLEGAVDLSVAGLQSFIDARVTSRRLTVRSVPWASAYTMSARLADRYRVGRTFLVGDAAHVHPPTGGQGLNTSIQDAYNLGWKLGAVLAGAPDTLLDTYEEERRPIAATVLGLSADLLEKASRGEMRRGREIHQLELGYPGCALSFEQPQRHEGLRAGDRMPDAALRGAGGQPRRLFDLLCGPHWTLLACGVSEQPLPAPQLDLHSYVLGHGGDVVDVEDQLATRCGLHAGDALLVRPDGYVGAIVAAADRAALLPYLTSLATNRAFLRAAMELQ